MKRLVLLLTVLLSMSSYSQNTMYFMDRMPQSISYNPAMMPKMKFYIGMPGFSANAYNNGFNYTELDNFIDNLKNPNYNPDEFVKSIGDYNLLTTELNASLFSFGFRLKDKGYLSFLWNANGIMNIKSASDIAYLVADFDNIDENDFPIVIDDITLSANSYLSFGFSYAHAITKNFTVGITPRIIFNQFGIKTSDLSYKVSLVQSGFDIDFEQTFSGEVALGLPVSVNPYSNNNGEFVMDEPLFSENWDQDITFNRMLKNKSLMLDIGAVYQLSKWNFSASLLNLGSSGYKTDGIVLNGNNDKISIRENEQIKITIPPKLYVGVMNQITPELNWGLLLNSNFYESKTVSSATASLNGTVGGGLSASVSYTAGYKFNNVGLGLRFRFFPGTDIYFVTDNLIQAFRPKNAYRYSAAAGINIAIGVKQKPSS